MPPPKATPTAMPAISTAMIRLVKRGRTRDPPAAARYTPGSATICRDPAADARPCRYQRPGAMRRPRQTIDRLLIAQGIDRMQAGGAPGRVDAEQQADRERDTHGQHDRAAGHQRLQRLAVQLLTVNQ